MFSISNKQFILLLCLILNIINLNESSDQNASLIDQESIKSTTEQEYIEEIVEHTEADISTENVSNEAPTDEQQQYESKAPDNRKAMDNLIRSHYRSSYISNKSTREKSDDLSLKKRKKKKPVNEFGNEIKYNVGPGVNISVEKDKELVSVYLDEDCLKDVFTGRGRKQDLITKILPLFILPFLIQSAVVPFLVSTLKLLLIKSIVVGKIAIFLLLLSAFKNHVKYAYEANPNPYYADAPNRRSEALTGYRVEGKPTTWIS